MFPTRVTVAVGLLLLAVTVHADKDDSYYIAGTGNPNKDEKMYWKDAENIFQDLSKFSTLYVEFHNCAWTWMQTSEADNDIEENDYWYMGKIPPMGANVAYSLYGSLKGDNFAGCGEKTFINSFYTNTGFTNFARAMNYAGLSGFSSYAYDDDSYSSYTSTCAGGYGVGCDYSNGFAVHTYSGKECNPANYTGVKDTLSTLNSAMKKASCVKIYDSSSYRGTPYGTPLEVLAYSHSCFYQDFFSPDAVCPDPYGKLQYYQQQFYNGIQESKKQDPYQVSKRQTQYTQNIEEGKILSVIGLFLVAVSVVSMLVEFAMFCCKDCCGFGKRGREEDLISKKSLGEIMPSHSEDMILSARRNHTFDYDDDDTEAGFSDSSAGGGYVTMTDRATRQLADLEAGKSDYVPPASMSPAEVSPSRTGEDTEGDFVNQTWAPPPSDTKEEQESILDQSKTILENAVDKAVAVDTPPIVSSQKPEEVTQKAPDTDSYIFGWIKNPWARNPIPDAVVPVAKDDTEVEGPTPPTSTEERTEDIDADVQHEEPSPSEEASTTETPIAPTIATTENEALPTSEAPPATTETPEAEDTETPEANETATPEANETATLDANETATPEATETAPSEANETPTPEADETQTAEANDTPTPEADETPTVEADETPTVEADDTPTPETNDTATPEAIDTEANDTPTLEGNDTTTPEVSLAATPEANDTASPEPGAPLTPEPPQQNTESITQEDEAPENPTSLESEPAGDVTKQPAAPAPISIVRSSSTDEGPKQQDAEELAVDPITSSRDGYSEDENKGVKDAGEVRDASDHASSMLLEKTEEELVQMMSTPGVAASIYESADTGILEKTESAIMSEYFDVNEASSEEFKTTQKPTSAAEKVPVAADTAETETNTDQVTLHTESSQHKQTAVADAVTTADHAASNTDHERPSPQDKTQSNTWFSW